MKAKLLLILSICLSVMTVMANASDNSESNVDEKNLTETITETTTDESYENYSEKYVGEDLCVGYDIPAGTYVVIPENNKTAYVNVYEFNGYKTAEVEEKRSRYSSYVEYRDVVFLSKDDHVSVTSGALVPSELVGKLDINKNGVFRVGIDIPAGSYTFKLSEGCSTSCISLKSLETGSHTTYYRLNKKFDSFTMKIDNGTIIKKYGADILDGSLKTVATYRPVENIESDNDKTYNFGDIRISFKSKIDSELSQEVNIYNYRYNQITRYKKSYVEEKIKSWKSMASNDAEKIYANMAGEIYSRFRDYVVNVALFAGSSYAKSYGDKVIVYSVEATKEAEKENYRKFFKDFFDADSFGKCEVAKINFESFCNNIPRTHNWYE